MLGKYRIPDSGKPNVRTSAFALTNNGTANWGTMALPNQTFKAELEAVQQTVGLPALEDADEVTKHVGALQHPN